ncbi:MAG: amino acid ABC transporter substrate-binding protein [Candidatus Bipolaricaulia bacterium]
MRKILIILLALLLPALLTPVLLIGQGGNTLQTVQARGKLVCGVNSGVPGFGFLGPDGTFSGFDTDYCRALAAAIFADPTKVEFVPLTAKERFTALQTGEIDVLIRNTTWTFVRDTEVGTNFAPTTFYDGQGFLVRKDSGITSIDDLDGATICVLSGTTTELNLADEFRKRGLSFTPVVFDETNAVYEAYEAGRCDAATSDKSQLAARRLALSNPDDHVILPETISKEPLGPVVRHGDDQWFDLVKWTVNCTIQAEEFGIDSTNVESFFGSGDPKIARLLGDEGDLGQRAFGLDNRWCANVIKLVGNYGELYEKNLTPLGLKREGSPNALWTNGGLLYSPPFR